MYFTGDTEQSTENLKGQFKKVYVYDITMNMI